MSLSVSEVLASFPALRVLVIGEAILDSYMDGTTERLCREAPVPVVDVAWRTDVPGGAANTAVNLAALGAQVFFLSVAGDDHEGQLLSQSLAAKGISTDYLLTQPGRRTLAKQRLLVNSELLVRFDQGDTTRISPASERQMLAHLESLFEGVQLVVISDYGYGILTPRLIQALTVQQARHPRIMVADAKNLGAYQGVGLTAAKPNYQEALQLLGMADPADRVAALTGQASRFLAKTRARIVAVTLDTDGALIFEGGGLAHRTYSQPAPHSRATGAGDTYVSALALALAAGATTGQAADLAAWAASIILTKEGTAACSLAELQQALLPVQEQPDLATVYPARKGRSEFGGQTKLESGQQAAVRPAR